MGFPAGLGWKRLMEEIDNAVTVSSAPDDEQERRLGIVERRIEELRREIEAFRARERRIARTRLAVFATGALITWIAFVSLKISGWWTVLPIVAFVALVVAHDRTIGRREVVERAARYWEGRRDRMMRAAGFDADDGARFADPQHPYAEDLELFGPGSLFALLSDARTIAGGETLARWLLQPSSVESIRERQDAIRELVERVNLREELAVVEKPAAGKSPFERLDVRPQNETAAIPGGMGPVLVALAMANVVTLFGWFVEGWGPTPFVVAVALSAATRLILAGGVNEALERIEALAGWLEAVSGLLRRVERERFESTRLSALVSALGSEGAPPSLVVARLDRLLALLDSGRNQLFMPVAALLHWRPLLAMRVDRWRRRHGSAVARWIDVIGEIEALVALAAFAWEHPGYAFPDISRDDVPIEAVGLGHPLIDPSALVRNDLLIGGATRVLIVSGSNMSGKSTLLRAVGVNVVLALAGAPACARRFSLPMIHVGASIVVRDSLQDGRSRFFAEISRIRQLVEISETRPPLLFLIDEVLHGTNSHDRRIGASAIIRGLVERAAIGLVTTHDLAIADVAGSLAGRARNVHFEDQIVDGRMTFDYRLRDGVVTRSNALDLMRSIGLDV